MRFEDLKARARELLDGLGGEAGVVVYGAAAVLVLSHYHGSTGSFRRAAGARFNELPWVASLPYFWWFFASVIFYMVLPLVLSFATRGSFNERYGFQLGDWRVGLKLTGLFLLVMLPATFIAAQLDAFKGSYPLAGKAAYLMNAHRPNGTFSPTLLALYELGYTAYFFAWEFLFRGWLIFGLVPKLGKPTAILMTVIPFAVMHFGKAELEALGSIIAAVALGVLAVRTRSFYYGFLLHAVVAVWMDLLSVYMARSGA